MWTSYAFCECAFLLSLPFKFKIVLSSGLSGTAIIGKTVIIHKKNIPAVRKGKGEGG
jgi:hypothetical protein